MARTLELDTITEPGNSGTANITLSSDTTTTMPLVDINGGAIDGTTVGSGTPSSVATTTLTASGATTLNGNVTLGNASSDTVTVTGTMAGFDNKSGMTGEIRMWGGSSAPTGWLLCNGANYDGGSVTYAALYAIIGQNFGIGDSTTDDFNVPDMEGRAPVGVGTGAGDAAEDNDGGTVPSGTALTARSLGEWTGREAGTFDTTLPAHTHTLSSHTHTMQSHTHAMQSHTHTMQNHTHAVSGTTDGESGHTHPIYVPWAGNPAVINDSAHEDGTSHYKGLMGNDQHRGNSGSSTGHTHTWSDTSDGPSNNTTAGPSNNTTAGPSNNTTAGPSTANTSSTGATGKHTIPIMCVNFIIKT